MNPADPRPSASGASEGEEEAGFCPKCHGTGFRVEEDPARGRSYARRCDCRRAGREKELLRLARIPKRYASCDFDSFYDLNPPLRDARALARAFVDDYTLRKVREEAEVGLLFIGPPGVGKTHLAVAALRALIIEHGVAGIFADFRDLMKTIQASYDPVSEASEMEVLRPLFQAEVLLLDDLGASKMTEWVRDTFGHIVSTRYNDRKVTLITTNLSDDPAGRASDRPSLSDRVGPSIRSRLHEMCVTLRMEGEDFRLHVKQSSRRDPTAT